MSDLKDFTNEQLHQLWADKDKQDKYIIIDIREPYEYRSEHIPNSINVPVKQLSSHDFSAYAGKIALFHCSSGNRTNAAKDIIMSCGIKETYCLPGGIRQWKSCNLPVIRQGKTGIDIMRQVQITAGTLVSVGVILGYMLSEKFYLLSLFIGLGLIFAGVSGTCGMAVLLSYMPWNRSK